MLEWFCFDLVQKQKTCTGCEVWSGQVDEAVLPTSCHGPVVKLDAMFAQSEFIPSSGTYECHLSRTRKYLETNIIGFARLQSIRSAWCQVHIEKPNRQRLRYAFRPPGGSKCSCMWFVPTSISPAHRAPSMLSHNEGSLVALNETNTSASSSPTHLICLAHTPWFYQDDVPSHPSHPCPVKNLAC